MLDLLAHRNVSSAIAERLQVEHQSPQLILIYKSKVLICRTHQAIEAEEVLAHIKTVNG